MLNPFGSQYSLDFVLIFNREAYYSDLLRLAQLSQGFQPGDKAAIYACDVSNLVLGFS